MYFRPLKKEDYNNGYIELLQSLTVTGEWTEERFIRHVSCINENTSHEIWVGYDPDTNKLISTGTILWEPKIIHGGLCVAHIEDVAIIQSCQKMGYGKQLVCFLIQRSKSKPIYKIILDCSDTSVLFYEKCGFSKKGNQMELRVPIPIHIDSSIPPQVVVGNAGLIPASPNLGSI